MLPWRVLGIRGLKTRRSIHRMRISLSWCSRSYRNWVRLCMLAQGLNSIWTEILRKTPTSLESRLRKLRMGDVVSSPPGASTLS